MDRLDLLDSKAEVKKILAPASCFSHNLKFGNFRSEDVFPKFCNCLTFVLCWCAQPWYVQLFITWYSVIRMVIYLTSFPFYNLQCASGEESFSANFVPFLPRVSFVAEGMLFWSRTIIVWVPLVLWNHISITAMRGLWCDCVLYCGFWKFRTRDTPISRCNQQQQPLSPLSKVSPTHLRSQEL